MITRDYHVHSTYSDGFMLPVMLRHAKEAGLAGVGIADHCIISERPEAQRRRKINGFNLDETYRRRRAAIEQLRDDFDIEIYDAVELDYAESDEQAIATFLNEIDFDYTIGSVHRVHGTDVQAPADVQGMTDSELDGFVEEYIEALISLAESDLFDIAAHPDLFERNQQLRGRASKRQYERVARAFERSNTFLELNAGSIGREYDEYHPRPSLLEVLLEYDIEFTVGTDSHWFESIAPRVEALGSLVAEKDITVTSPLS